jgi:NADH-quinone oxidoreductase subunit J
VAILAVFAIMMTRSAEQSEQHDSSSFRLSGAIIAVITFAVLAWTISSGTKALQVLSPQPEASVNQIGIALMHRYVLPLEVIGLLLTAALIGAGVLAMEETRGAR